MGITADIIKSHLFNWLGYVNSSSFAGYSHTYVDEQEKIFSVFHMFATWFTFIVIAAMVFSAYSLFSQFVTGILSKISTLVSVVMRVVFACAILFFGGWLILASIMEGPQAVLEFLGKEIILLHDYLDHIFSMLGLPTLGLGDDGPYTIIHTEM